MRDAAGDDVVTRLVLLQHKLHRADIVAREPPVALRIHAAQLQRLREADS